MRKTVKFLSAVLSAVLALGTLTFAASAKFNDVPASNKALTRAVDLLASVGITKGTSSETFGTNEKVTRQQMAAFIYRMMKAGKSVEGGDNLTPFTDLDDPTFYFMISWASENKVIKGTSKTTFNPKGEITLQDAYVMLVRALGYEKDVNLNYPYDYIDIAEEIGLDEDVPSNLKFDSPLSRGNVAILLYNAIYADMAGGHDAYKTIIGTEELEDGTIVVFENGQELYTEYDNVAEKIFKMEKTVQRVVATPNYGLDRPTTDNDEDGEEVVSLAVFDDDYIEDDGLFGDYPFSELGLEGKADDYFLMDLSIYYKEDSASGEPKIFAATSKGTRTNYANGKIKFVAETKDSRATNFQTSASSSNSENRTRRFTGEVLIDGVSNYVFDAPYSFTKGVDVKSLDDKDITFIGLGATQRDPDSEDFVQDYNFMSDVDVFCRGDEYWDSIRGWYNTGANNEALLLKDVSSRGKGLYSDYGVQYYMGIDPHTYAQYEADCWDSDGDGLVDYMWTKPYCAGRIDTDEGEGIDSHRKASTLGEKFGPIYNSDGVPTIYTAGATVEGGITLKAGSVFTGYINADANYIKVGAIADWEYVTKTYTGNGSDSNTVYFDGSSSGMWGASLKYINFVGSNGLGEAANIERVNTKATLSVPTSSGPYNSKYFSSSSGVRGLEYNLVYVNGTVMYAKPATTQVVASDYAIIFPNTLGKYAYTVQVAEVYDGKLERTGNYIDVYMNGEIMSVPVKPQTNKGLADIAHRPYTAWDKDAKAYDFSDYVNKLLTYSQDKISGDFTFRIVPVSETENHDPSVLKDTKDDNLYYFNETDEYGATTSAFIQSKGTQYMFVKKGTSQHNSIVCPATFVNFNDSSKFILKTEEDGEDVFTTFDIDNLPNFSNTTELKNIKFILRNNIHSTAVEDLVYMYAEAADTSAPTVSGKTYDYRIVKSHAITTEGDERIVYYDVMNPFTGKTELEYEASSDTENVVCDNLGIYPVTAKGAINDEYKFGSVDKLGKVADSDTRLKDTGFGLVEIASYDDEEGLLEVVGDDMFYIVDDDTVVTFLDLDEKDIELVVKSASILSGKSKTYRIEGEDHLYAFIASTEIKKEDMYEHAEIIVVVKGKKVDLT